MRVMTLIVAWTLVAAGHAQAQDSATEMLAGCRDYVGVGRGKIPAEKADLGAAAECVGTIKTILILEKLLTPDFRFCRPQGVTINDAVEIAVQEIEKRPTMRNLPFVIMAIAAFQQRWPCNE